MGFFKNLVGSAVSDGIGNALSKAVEKAVAPAAERFATKQAEALDNVTKKTAEVMEQSAAAMDKAQKDLEAAAAQPAEGAAAPQRQLTEEERKQAEEASAALKGFGMMFSGAIAQAKKEEEEEKARKAAAEAAIFENWEQNLGAYPKWDVGGSHFVLEEDMPRNGYPAYRLILDGRPFLVEMYASKLRSAGFIARGCSNPLDLNADTYYKIIDGVCWSWNRTDACMDGQVCTYFYVDTPPRQEPPRNNNSGSGLEGLAKGLFKKIVR
jgi:hypothetical protein